MEESDQPEKKKHTTKAVTSEPQEEFIEPEAGPSQPEDGKDASAAQARIVTRPFAAWREFRQQGRISVVSPND